MSKNLADDPSTFQPQTSPINGQPRTAESVEAPFQRAANRAAYLKRRLDLIQHDDEGIRRLRSVGSFAELKALADRPDGTICSVANVGLYRFDGASIVDELAPLALRPNTVGPSDPGRWLVHGVGDGMLNVPNGLPTLDGAGRLPTARLAASDGTDRILGKAIKHGLIDVVSKTVPSALTSSGTFVDVPQASVSLELLAGDRVSVFGAATQYQDDMAGEAHFTRWSVVTPSSVTVHLASTVREHFNELVNRRTTFPVDFSYTAAADGAHTLKMQHRNAGAGGGMALEQIYILAFHLRP